MPKTVFVFCGGARTFLQCFDICYEKVISRLCPDPSDVTLLFYMKLTDPGPKQQEFWNYEYADVNYNETVAKINEYRGRGIRIFDTILFHSEINDIDLMLSVKDRSLYDGFNSSDVHFIRALHQAYNFEQCGKRILEIEKAQGYQFDFAVYVRPDLIFFTEAPPLSEIILDKVVMCTGVNAYIYDHFAIVPRVYLEHFFLEKMETYRTNTTKTYETPEMLYIEVNHRVETIAHYNIQR